MCCDCEEILEAEGQIFRLPNIGVLPPIVAPPLLLSSPRANCENTGCYFTWRLLLMECADPLNLLI